MEEEFKEALYDVTQFVTEFSKEVTREVLEGIAKEMKRILGEVLKTYRERGPQILRERIHERRNEIYKSLEEIRSAIKPYSERIPLQELRNVEYRINYFKQKTRELSVELCLLEYLERRIDDKKFEELIKSLYDRFSEENIRRLIREEASVVGKEIPHFLIVASLPELMNFMEKIEKVPFFGKILYESLNKELEKYGIDDKVKNTLYDLIKVERNISAYKEAIKYLQPLSTSSYKKSKYSNYVLLFISFIMGASIASLINTSKSVTGMLAVSGQLFVINVALIFVTLILFFLIVRNENRYK